MPATDPAAYAIETTEPGRGRDADSPAEIPAAGWKDILLRVKDEIADDRVGLIAAGCTYYLLLALFPALAAIVSVYGLAADRGDVARQVASLSAVLPAGGISIIEEQLMRLAEQPAAGLGLALIASVLFSLWNTSNGIKTLVEAMNVAYDEREKRGLLRLTLTSLAFTVGALVLIGLFIFAFGVIPAILDMVGVGRFSETLITVLRWPFLWGIAAFGLSLLYRYGPSRPLARWRWITTGSMVAAATWIVASVAMGIYLTNFANYDATYGSLGAVVGFMAWLWLSVFIVIAGAELDAEIEHQTVRDSTTGQPRPLGMRGAAMADSVGQALTERNRPSRRAAAPFHQARAPRQGNAMPESLIAERVGRAIGSTMSRHRFLSIVLAGLALLLRGRNETVAPPWRGRGDLRAPPSNYAVPATTKTESALAKP